MLCSRPRQAMHRLLFPEALPDDRCVRIRLEMHGYLRYYGRKETAEEDCGSSSQHPWPGE